MFSSSLRLDGLSMESIIFVVRLIFWFMVTSDGEDVATRTIRKVKLCKP